MRNNGVHFESEHRDGVHQHPNGSQTAYELTVYTLEKSTQALVLGRSVVASCAASTARGACDEAARFLVPELPGVMRMLDEVMEAQGLRGT